MKLCREILLWSGVMSTVGRAHLVLDGINVPKLCHTENDSFPALERKLDHLSRIARGVYSHSFNLASLVTITEAWSICDKANC